MLSASVMGISLAAASGLMGGMFTLPMRYLSRWSWENVWAVYIVVACVLIPSAAVLVTVTDPLRVLAIAPARAEMVALLTGFAWGVGSILFGLGVSANGISMANTVILAMSASLGSILPLLILAPERIWQPAGKAILLGTVTAVFGMCLCGFAGILRERDESGSRGAPRKLVGTARPVWVGLFICVGAGAFSAFFNVGYSLAQGIVQTAVAAE